MRSFAIVRALVLVVILLAGCTSATPAPTSTPAPPSPTAKPAATVPISPTAAPRPAATSVSKPEKPSQQLATVRFATLGTSGDGPVFIAVERGYFREEGLDVQIDTFDSAVKIIPALAAGQLDVGAGGISAGLFNAIGRAIPLKIVADKGSVAPGFDFYGLAARKDLVDSGQLKDYKDMKGKRVAITNKGTLAEIVIDQALAKGGLKLSDVELVEMGFPDVNVAFANKSIDMAMHTEPLYTVATERGLAVRWKSYLDFYENPLISVLMYSPKFASENSDAGRRFMVAYLKGVRDFVNAFKHNKDRAAIIEIIANNTTVKDRALLGRMVAQWMNPDGYLHAKSLTDAQDWFVKRGYVKDPVDLGRVIDNSFVDYAIQRLGR